MTESFAETSVTPAELEEALRHVTPAARDRCRVLGIPPWHLAVFKRLYGSYSGGPKAEKTHARREPQRRD